MRDFSIYCKKLEIVIIMSHGIIAEVITNQGDLYTLLLHDAHMDKEN